MGEWKQYATKGPIQADRYIIVLEERVAELEAKCALAVVVGQSEQLVCGTCDKYRTCKELLEENAPACKIYGKAK